MSEETCHYCSRPLQPRGTDSPLAATRDHVVPKSKGGRKTVPCCRTCNEIKADRLPDEWAAYMAENPMWWGTADERMRDSWRRKGRATLEQWAAEGHLSAATRVMLGLGLLEATPAPSSVPSSTVSRG